MQFKRIHIIINSASGQDEAILSYLNKAWKDKDIEWNISITKKTKDATEMARQLARKVNLVAIYGGDGSVSEVAQGLQGQPTPMAIIQGERPMWCQRN